MLKNIDPVLNADVLYALRAAGHGDNIIVTDMNFPSDAIARQTTIGEVLRIDNLSAPRAIEAILSVLPLDTFGPCAACMEIVDNPDEVPPVQFEVQQVLNDAQGNTKPMERIERWAFYEEAKQAYCIITTGEKRFYGCFKFTKGVIPPEDV